MYNWSNSGLFGVVPDHPVAGVVYRSHRVDELLNDSIYESDEFRMYGFKIKKCPRTRSHDWTQCPFAHQGEKARRRDPRKYSYTAVACPDFKTGECRKGDACQFAHGVFEYWLHPARYRTRTCNAGELCKRTVCFFAHSPQQLRSELKYKSRYFTQTVPGNEPSASSELALAPDETAMPSARLAPASLAARVGGKQREREMDGDDLEFPDVEWIWELLE